MNNGTKKKRYIANMTVTATTVYAIAIEAGSVEEAEAIAQTAEPRDGISYAQTDNDMLLLEVKQASDEEYETILGMAKKQADTTDKAIVEEILAMTDEKRRKDE